MKITILNSAKKHGVPDHDIIYVLENYIAYFELDADKQKFEYIGFDTLGKVLEIITVEINNAEITVIHAMRATKTNLDKAGLL